MSAEQSEVEQELDQTGQDDKTEIPEGFVPVDENQRQVNKQHKRFREEERAHQKTQRELEEARKRLSALENEAQEVEIPPPPDPLDEDFESKQKDREDAIKQAAVLDARRDSAKAEEERQAERAKADRAAEQDRQFVEFRKKSSELGLKPEEIENAAKDMWEHGVSETLEEAILTDQEGPLFLTYLSRNPLETEKLNGMSAYQLANYLHTEVRPKAQLLKPQTSQAPDPPETLSGGGVQEIEHPLLKGAKFE